MDFAALLKKLPVPTTMWIRNKGTRECPQYVLVESQRKDGQKHPSQKILFYLGKSPTVEAAISLYEILSEAARSNNNQSLLDTHAKGLTLSQIDYRLRKLKSLKVRMDKKAMVKTFSEEIVEEKRKYVRTSRSIKMKLKLMALQKFILMVRSDGNVSKWSPEVRRSIVNLMDTIMTFKKDLKIGR